MYSSLHCRCLFSVFKYKTQVSLCQFFPGFFCNLYILHKKCYSFLVNLFICILITAQKEPVFCRIFLCGIRKEDHEEIYYLSFKALFLSPCPAAGNLSYKISYHIVSAADQILEKNLSEADKEYYAGEIELPVRKLAHMTEYCILAICISFPLYVYGLRGFWLFIFAGLFCVAFACTDEFHQSFVAGRSPAKADVAIDSLGALFGIILVQLFCHSFTEPSR